MRPATITLRPTQDADLDAVAVIETAEDTERWLGDTSAAWHRAALEDPHQEHLILLTDHRMVGFAVLARATEPDRSTELRRLVVATKHRGRGLGRDALRCVVAHAVDAGAHRIWLDVKEANERACALYESEGFVREGLLREAFQERDGSWSCLVVMAHVVTAHVVTAQLQRTQDGAG